jgi:hypothetical protein
MALNINLFTSKMSTHLSHIVGVTSSLLFRTGLYLTGPLPLTILTLLLFISGLYLTGPLPLTILTLLLFISGLYLTGPLPLTVMDSS